MYRVERIYWECNWCAGCKGCIGSAIGVQAVVDVLGV